MNQSHFHHVGSHQNQRFIGGALLPFLAGALVTAPFYLNRPGCYGGGCGYPPYPAPYGAPYGMPYPAPYGMPYPYPYY